ncbi:hypothetical protein [Pseudoxanthomonas dokdonensis]|uniref:Phytase n=1 Tax=Pseudoxanthomonas dokdonensis TaxID=344882 RepID=A0A0R0CHY4_9GAMM|nr:hypothetical protein [Pseudoxanthomonas dokdonensis]KRG69088.1 phytase [Pseudoxanthomonas dokdonensis]
MKNNPLALAAIVMTVLLSACASNSTGSDRPDADERGSAAHVAAADTRDIPTVQESLLTPMTPPDNVDSPATWHAADGSVLLLATAKKSDRLMVYDGLTGASLRTVGGPGRGAGQFNRPNGIAVVGDMALVVERDNHRVQVLALPEMKSLGSFGAGELIKPYGLWVNPRGDGWDVYVTDAYMAGEDAMGEDILPPLAQLDKRVKRYHLRVDGGQAKATLEDQFGDTGEAGALRIVESIWGDPSHDRLLIAEEDESFANELKIYRIDGHFTGKTLGQGRLLAQAEGVMLKTCGDQGWWVATEQGKQRSIFHLFARDTLEYAGAVAGHVVANTDGIWVDNQPSSRFPQGALYAVHDDQGVVAFDWREIARALSLPACTVTR